MAKRRPRECLRASSGSPYRVARETRGHVTIDLKKEEERYVRCIFIILRRAMTTNRLIYSVCPSLFFRDVYKRSFTTSFIRRHQNRQTNRSIIIPRDILFCTWTNQFQERFVYSWKRNSIQKKINCKSKCRKIQS